jgi:hypothetical protein
MLTALRDEADTAPQLAAAVRALDCPEGLRAVKRLIATGDEVMAFTLRRLRWPRRLRLLAAAIHRDGPGAVRPCELSALLVEAATPGVTPGRLFRGRNVRLPFATLLCLSDAA